MTSCTFAEFFDACKDRLTDTQLRALEAGHEYFQFKAGGFCGLEFTSDDAGDSVWVSIFVGELADIWEFRRLMVEAGVSRVGFACRPGGVTDRLAKYYEAECKLSGLTYSDGGARLDCVIYPQQTQRLRKSVPLKAAV